MLSRKNVLLIGRIIVSVVLIFYLVSMIDIKRLYSIIGDTRTVPLLAAPVLTFFSFIFAAFRWKLVLRELGISRKLRELYTYYIRALFYSMVLPGAVGGDVVRVAMCTRGAGAPLAYVATSAFLERVCGLFILFLIGASVVLFAPSSIPQGINFPLLQLFPVMVLCLTIFAAFSVVLSRSFGEKIKLESIPKTWLRKTVQFGILLSQIKFRSFFLLLVYSGLFQATGIIADFCLAEALNISLSLPYFFCITSIVFIASAFPVSLGGLGVRESVLVYFLSTTGITTSDAIIFSFLIYCNRVAVSILGTIFQFIINYDRNKGLLWFAKGTEK